MANKRALLILGGMWHDFEGFTRFITPVLAPEGYDVHPTYDLDVLTRLGAEGCDLLISYTSLSKHREGHNDTGPEALTDEQVNGLASWLRGGGVALAVHSAMVAGSSSPLYGQLLGGVFVTHPPQFSFTVYPCYREHPITAGVDAFTVRDEFYVEQYDASVQIHMVALDRGVAHPMVWTKSEGRGQVAHIAMGHDQKVWRLPPYQKLIVQAARWLTAH